MFLFKLNYEKKLFFEIWRVLCFYSESVLPYFNYCFFFVLAARKLRPDCVVENGRLEHYLCVFDRVIFWVNFCWFPLIFMCKIRRNFESEMSLCKTESSEKTWPSIILWGSLQHQVVPSFLNILSRSIDYDASQIFRNLNQWYCDNALFTISSKRFIN